MDELYDTTEEASYLLSSYVATGRREALEASYMCYQRARELFDNRQVAPSAQFLVLTVALAEQFAEIHHRQRGPEGELVLELIEPLRTVMPIDMRAHAQVLLAQVLSDLPIGSRQANFQSAILLLEETIILLKRNQASALQISEVLMELGYTYSMCQSGYEADNAELAIAYLEEAAVLADADSNTRIRGMIMMYLGDGFFGRQRGHASENLKKSAQYYEAAAGLFLQSGAKDRAARALSRYNYLTPKIAQLESGRVNTSRGLN